MDELLGLLALLLEPKLLIIILIAGLALTVPYYVGTRVGESRNPEMTHYRGFNKQLRQCEKELPRNQRCTIDWSKAILFTEDNPTTTTGKLIDWAKNR